MHATMQALETFRRNRLLDGATSDDDKLAAVYKLDEICELAQSSSSDIVRDMVDYIVKNRLDNKSPYVKQKALRLIKFALPKAGKEFRRAVQLHSSTIRGLFHYKGQPDPLKGDSLNKAVRDMAHETIQALYSQEESKFSSSDPGGNRMQAFGNTPDRPADDRRASGAVSLSSVVELGSESFKQGLNLIRDAAGQASNSLGYRGQSLHKSLTSASSESKYDSRYKGSDERKGNDSSSYSETRDYGSSRLGSYQASDEVSATTPWESKSSVGHSNGRSSFEAGQPQTEEERLVESMTQAGGVRLQPSREALQVFVSSASKLDGAPMGVALETKLRVNVWQVRLKATCLLEALLRNEGDPVCDTVYRFFKEDASAIIDCLESPQSSLREKAKRTLELLNLGYDQPQQHLEDPATSEVPISATLPTAVPNLLDTSDPEPHPQQFDSPNEATARSTSRPEDSSAQPLASPDLLGGDFWSNGAESGISSTSSGGTPLPDGSNIADPFAGMSVSGAGGEADLFSGLQVDPSHSESSQNEDLGGLLGPGVSETGGLFEGLNVSTTEVPMKTVDSLAGIMGSYPSVPSSQPLVTPAGAAFGRDLGQMGVAGQIGNGQGMPGLTGLRPPTLPAAGPMPMHRFTPQEQQMLFQQQLLYMQAMGMGGMRPMAMPAILPGVIGQQGFPGVNFGQPGFAGFGGVQGPGLGVGLGGTSSSGLSGGPGSMPGSNDGFDFSSDSKSRYQTAPEAKKEETKAFDFVADHLKSASTMGQKKGPALKS